jgi:hypothetical protein
VCQARGGEGQHGTDLGDKLARVDRPGNHCQTHRGDVHQEEVRPSRVNNWVASAPV